MDTLHSLETPAVVIDIDKLRRNLARAQSAADAAGLALRPHIKTHKSLRLAQEQIAQGAVGVTCQKLGEAEVMADGGIDDILLTYNILGAAKLARLRALADRCRLAVTCDSAAVAEGYRQVMAGADRPLSVLVECDTGMGRCGVQTAEAALDLARVLEAAPGLRFGGLMTYPAAGGVQASRDWLARAVALLSDHGLPPRIVTTGGTPDIWDAMQPGIVTEYRPGTYIYMDRSQIAAGACTSEECALQVLATVVSTPAPGRAVIDAGSKTLTSDAMGLEGFGFLPDHPEARIVTLSEEHGVMDVSRCAVPPELGARVRIIPNHACPVSNLFDTVWLLDPEGGATPLRVDARGCVT
ncbi:D-TA family PLP-dependent enzyme [Salipiger marinus]|uniref:D-TA family PLP-dependent enzyme n=1 Tax=Salipiger marinus TaxID=555512 RepID=UPI0040582CB3